MEDQALYLSNEKKLRREMNITELLGLLHVPVIIFDSNLRIYEGREKG